MKPSHFATPRSLGECHFAGNADPIEKPTTDRWHELGHRVALPIACALGLLWVLFWSIRT